MKNILAVCSKRYVFLVFGILFLRCQKQSLKEDTFIVIGSDTLSENELVQYCSDSVAYKTKAAKIGLMIAVADKAPVSIQQQKKHDKIINDLMELLYKESNKEWTYKAADKIYRASRVIKQGLESGSDIQPLQSVLDSASAHIVIFSDTQYNCTAPDMASLLQRHKSAEKRKLLALVLNDLFCFDTVSAFMISSFIYSEDIAQIDTLKNVGQLIEGLSFNTTAMLKEETVTQSQIENVKQKDHNIIVALQYRTQQSIADSIKKHIPYIQGLYKQQLRLNTSMEGIVYVTFQVNPSGSIASAQIKTSDITHQQFLTPFIEYVKKIHFKPVPENIGIMTFDFPFEFNPE